MLARELKICAIALSYPPRVRVRATVKLSAAFFHDESSITIEGGGGGGESAIAPLCQHEQQHLDKEKHIAYLACPDNSLTFLT